MRPKVLRNPEYPVKGGNVFFQKDEGPGCWSPKSRVVWTLLFKLASELVSRPKAQKGVRTFFRRFSEPTP